MGVCVCVCVCVCVRVCICVYHFIRVLCSLVQCNCVSSVAGRAGKKISVCKGHVRREMT